MLERIKGYFCRQEKRSGRVDADKRLLFSKDFWIALPERYSAITVALQTQSRCDLWAEEAAKALGADGYEGAFQKKWKGDMGNKTWLWDMHHVWQHQYIEVHGEDGRRYIADGTAGQFFDSCSEYAKGYFGFLDEAPALLQDIYKYNES